MEPKTRRLFVIAAATLALMCARISPYVVAQTTAAPPAVVVVSAPGVADAPLAEPAARRRVRLVIYGEFPSELLGHIEAGLRRELDVDTLPVVRRALPDAAYYPPRKRYRAEKLLDALEQQSPGVSQLGLTSVDISTTKGKYRDWGIFGLGSMGGDSAVISTFRLRRGARDADHRRLRVVSVAVHEVGHMLGLPHCDEARCVMNDAHGSIRSVDNSPGGLGPMCRTLVDRLAPAR